MINKVSRGDVFYYNFGNNWNNSVEAKQRPCVVISNNQGNTYGSTCLVAPITSRPAQKAINRPWQVCFKNGTKDQTIFLEQIRVVAIKDLFNYLGRLDDMTMNSVDIALCVELDLPISNDTLNNHKLIEDAYYRLNAGVQQKLSSFDELEKRLESKIENSLTCNVNAISNMNIEQNKELYNELKFEIKTIKDSFSTYTKNIDKMVNVLINMYQQLNNKNTVEQVDVSTNIDTIQNDNSCVEEIKNDKKRVYIKTLNEKKRFLEYYLSHTYEEITQEYGFDKKSAVNRRSNYLNVLKKAGIDCSTLDIIKPSDQIILKRRNVNK